MAMTKTKSGLKGLLLLAGKPKGDAADNDAEEGPPESSGEPAGVEDESLSRAFDAATDGDKDAFISNMKRAFRECIDAEKEGEY